MISDLDKGVSIEAIRLTTTLQQNGLLAHFHKAVDAAMLVADLGDMPPPLWKALGPMLQLFLHSNSDPAVAAGEADAGSGRTVQHLAAGDVSRLAQSPLVQLSALIQRSPSQSLEPGAPSDPTDADSALVVVDEAAAIQSEVRKEAALGARCRRMVSAMRAHEPALTDWAAYVEILTADASADSTVETAVPNVLRLMAAAAGELNAAYDAAAEGDAPDDDDDDDDGGGGGGDGGRVARRRGKAARKAAAANEAECATLQSALGKCLPTLVERYGAHESSLRLVLALVCQLRLSPAQAVLKGKRFETLLAALEAVTLKHSDHATLAACGRAWSSLMKQSGAPGLLEAVQVRSEPRPPRPR